MKKEPQGGPMMVSINNVGPGWHPIIEDLEQKLEDAGFTWEVLQIKEKFGGLRYYASFESVTADEVTAAHVLIDEAERLSMQTCETCGTREGVTTEGSGWLKTLCPSCRAKHKAEHKARMAEAQAAYEASKK